MNSDFLSPSLSDRLASLRAKSAALDAEIKALEDEIKDPVLTFDVTLRVTSRASTWDDEVLNAEEMQTHFEGNMREIKSVLWLGDKGDSIKVVKCAQVE